MEDVTRLSGWLVLELAGGPGGGTGFTGGGRVFQVYQSKNNMLLLQRREETMGANLALSAADFEKEVLQSDVPVLVDFWATWCRPCVAIAPFVEEVATELAGKAKVFKVDVDANGELAQTYGIMSIPALVVFKGGQEVDRLVGAGPKETIKQLVEKHV